MVNDSTGDTPYAFPPRPEGRSIHAGGLVNDWVAWHEAYDDPFTFGPMRPECLLAPPGPLP